MATTELKDPPFHLNPHTSVRLAQLPSASTASSLAATPPTSPPAGSGCGAHHHYNNHNHQLASDIQVHSTAKHHNHQALASTDSNGRSFPPPVLGPLVPHPGKTLSPEEAAAAADREVNGNYYAHSANPSPLVLKPGLDLPGKDPNPLNLNGPSSNSSPELVLKMPGYACRYGSEDLASGNQMGSVLRNGGDSYGIPSGNNDNYECSDSDKVKKPLRKNGMRDMDFDAVEQQCGLPYVVTDGALRSLTSSASSLSSSSLYHESKPDTGSHVTFQIGGVANGAHEDNKDANSAASHHASSASSLSSTSSSLYLKRQRSGSATGSYDGSLERIIEDQVSVHPLPAHLLERSLSCSVVEPPSHSRTSTRSSVHDNSDTASCSSVEGMILGGLTSPQHNPSPSGISENLDNVSLSSDPHIGLATAEENGTLSSSNTTDVPSDDLSQNACASSERMTDPSDKLYPNEAAAAIRPKSLDPRSLCLPLPFRFLSGKTSSSSSPTSKGKSVLDAKSPSAGGPTSPNGPRYVGKGRPAPKQSWLLRLFESKMFDMSIAIQYLYNSKEPGVQTYIGKCRVLFDMSIAIQCACLPTSTIPKGQT